MHDFTPGSAPLRATLSIRCRPVGIVGGGIDSNLSCPLVSHFDYIPSAARHITRYEQT